MIATFVAAAFLVLAVLFILAFGYFKKEAKVHEADEYGTKAQDARNAGTASVALTIICFGIAATILFFASYETVDAKTQGVVTTHGRVHEETAKPGWLWKKPWDKVTQISTATEGKKYHGDNAIEVRLKDGNKAFVSTAVRSGVAPERANKVFESFRNYDDPTVEFRSQIVSDQLKAAMYRSFREVDPLSLSNQSEQPLDIAKIEEQITEDLIDRGDGMINADELRVTITLITPDKKAQAVIDKYTDEVNKTRTAIQAQKTATEQAKANKILADSINKDPNVLVSRCLDLIEAGALKLPAGGSCWPNGNSGVVIPGTN